VTPQKRNVRGGEIKRESDKGEGAQVQTG